MEKFCYLISVMLLISCCGCSNTNNSSSLKAQNDSLRIENEVLLNRISKIEACLAKQDSINNSLKERLTDTEDDLEDVITFLNNEMNY